MSSRVSRGRLLIVIAVAKHAVATLADFEAGKRMPYARTLQDIRCALEAGGVIFVEANGEGAGVRLKKQTRKSAR